VSGELEQFDRCDGYRVRRRPSNASLERPRQHHAVPGAKHFDDACLRVDHYHHALRPLVGPSLLDELLWLAGQLGRTPRRVALDLSDQMQGGWLVARRGRDHGHVLRQGDRREHDDRHDDSGPGQIPEHGASYRTVGLGLSRVVSALFIIPGASSD
jgi:hypothetical protein